MAVMFAGQDARHVLLKNNRVAGHVVQLLLITAQVRHGCEQLEHTAVPKIN